MHQRAIDSDIIIVNHHLFFADLAVKEEDYGGIIPEYTAVIFDEAHEVEDVAGQYFGLSISNYQMQELRRDVAAMARRKDFGSAELDRVMDSLEEHSGRSDLFPADAAVDCAGRLSSNAMKSATACCSRARLIGSLAPSGLTRGDPAGPPRADPRRALRLDEDVNHSSSTDRQRGRDCFRSHAIGVAPILSEKLFDRVDAVK
jgi:hypothetical protein